MKGKLNKCFTNYVKDYIDDGCIWGYLGHEHRNEKTDILLEEALEKYPNKKYNGKSLYELVGVWLCSRPARHTMDLLENEKLFKEFISNNENIEEMISGAYSWNEI